MLFRCNMPGMHPGPWGCLFSGRTGLAEPTALPSRICATTGRETPATGRIAAVACREPMVFLTRQRLYADVSSNLGRNVCSLLMNIPATRIYCTWPMVFCQACTWVRTEHGVRRARRPARGRPGRLPVPHRGLRFGVLVYLLQ